MAKQPTLYRDLDLNFTRHPVTNDVNQLVDTEAVKKSIKNLVLMNRFDKPFHPEINSSVYASFFENMGPIQIDQLKSQIRNLIEKYEPRVVLTEINISNDKDSNDLIVFLYFIVKNLQTPISFTVSLARNR